MEGELHSVRAVKRLLLVTPVRDSDTSWTLGVVWISRDVDDSREEEGAFLVAQWLRIHRGHGFKPWSGKIPHAAEQLSPCATTAEPAL